MRRGSILLTALALMLFPIGAGACILEDLGDLVIRARMGSMTPEDIKYLQALTPEDVDEINGCLANQRGVEPPTFDQEEEFLADNPSPNVCDPINDYPRSGYLYFRAYTWWLKWEWNGPDLMFEYAHYPANCQPERYRHFWIKDNNLYYYARYCGVHPTWMAMEGCKRRVTTVMGFSVWRFVGADTCFQNTLLGFYQ